MNTIRSESPGFVDPTQDDYRPAVHSALIDKGTKKPEAVQGLEVPNALARPLFQPPLKAKLNSGQAATRKKQGGKIDVGAYEFSPKEEKHKDDKDASAEVIEESSVTDE